ncbi:MAG: hypothetical protein WKF71_05190 [Pyrinomonadaceae bacterium]
MINPTFPGEEFEKYRAASFNDIPATQGFDPNAISDLVYNKVLYGETHPYSRQLSGDVDIG